MGFCASLGSLTGLVSWNITGICNSMPFNNVSIDDVTRAFNASIEGFKNSPQTEQASVGCQALITMLFVSNIMNTAAEYWNKGHKVTACLMYTQGAVVTAFSVTSLYWLTVRNNPKSSNDYFPR